VVKRLEDIADRLEASAEETSIKEDTVLVTDDTDLGNVTKQYGGQSLSVAQLLLHCTKYRQSPGTALEPAP
jgi:hypothetical protein